MPVVDRAYGLCRSLWLYYGGWGGAARLDRFYRPFVPVNALCFDIGAHVGSRSRCWSRLGARVVAVDEQGNRSGPSDYAATPRPVIYSKPVVQARTGMEYRYDVLAIRSIGDLRTRVVDGREVMNYWDVEKPRFEIDQGPKWLSIDSATGQFSGKPEGAGRSEVTVSVTLESERRSLDQGQLQWGIERSTGSRRETVGIARQTFVIETVP